MTVNFVTEERTNTVRVKIPLCARCKERLPSSENGRYHIGYGLHLYRSTNVYIEDDSVKAGRGDDGPNFVTEVVCERCADAVREFVSS